MVKKYLPRNNDRILYFTISPELSAFIVKKTSFFTIAVLKFVKVILYGITGRPLKNVSSRLNNNKRHTFERYNERQSILFILKLAKLFLDKCLRISLIYKLDRDHIPQFNEFKRGISASSCDKNGAG